MTIKEVSEKYGITQDTLRYYERVGMIPQVTRTAGGIRNYSEEDLRWVELSCLQFCLNVHQQIDLRRLCLCDCFLSWGMRFLPGENCPQFFHSIPFAQTVHAGCLS